MNQRLAKQSLERTRAGDARKQLGLALAARVASALSLTVEC